MKRFDKTSALMTEINITPFTDVMLVLLIIFMIATPLISQNSIEIKLPEAASKDSGGDLVKPASITVTSEGVVYFENKILTKKELRGGIDALLKKNPGLTVVVAADEACRFQEVVGVIDTLEQAGVKSLNIATKSNEPLISQ